MSTPVAWNLKGGLDLDHGYIDIVGGRMADARNIKVNPKTDRESGGISAKPGNVFAFDLGTVSPQNKIWRIKLHNQPDVVHEIDFWNTQRDYRLMTMPTATGSFLIGDTPALWALAINTYAPAGVFAVTTGPDYVDIELTQFPYYDWHIDQIRSYHLSGANFIQPELIVTQDAITTELAGPLRHIGEEDVMGDLFIMSTTNENLPETTSLNIISVGAVSSGGATGPLTTLTFNIDHGLQAGESFSINGSTLLMLNGQHVVQQVISPTQISIVSNVTWGAIIPITPTTGETIIRFPQGMGDIGVATRDNDIPTWTYTRLVRSRQLNFCTRKGIRTDGRVKAGRKRVYFTDKYNSVRAFQYYGDYVLDGLLAHINPKCSINLAYLSSQMNLIAYSYTNELVMTYTGQSLSGGELACGNKYYTYRLIDYSGSKSAFAPLTDPVPVYMRDPFEGALEVRGEESTSISSKAVNFELTGFKAGLFEKIEFGVIEDFGNGSRTGSVFEPTMLTGDTVLFTHRGTGQNMSPLDLGELYNNLNGSFSRAGDLTIIDKRLALADLDSDDSIDLREWAKQIRHTLRYREIYGTGNLALKGVGGYMLPEHVNNYAPVPLNETVRVGIYIEMNNGTSTPVYWVDDIRIDAEPTNTANPTDNRRIAGLPDYRFQNDDSPYSYLIPYIEFTNIDPNILIAGTPLKQQAKRVRFVIAPIIEEVISTGICVVGASGSHLTAPVVTVGASNIAIRQQADRSNSSWICEYPLWEDSFLPKDPLSPSPSNVEYGPSMPLSSSTFSIEKRYCAFYSPEMALGMLDDYESTTADKLIVLGKARIKYRTPTSSNDEHNAHINSSGALVVPNSNGIRLFRSIFLHLLASNNGATTNTIDITEAAVIEAGQTKTIGGRVFTKYHDHVNPASGSITDFALSDRRIDNARSLVLRTTSDIVAPTGAPMSMPDYGVYICQLFRERPNKYGDKDSQFYNPTGCYADIATDFSILSTVDFYGGNHFSGSHLDRLRWANENAVVSGAASGAGDAINNPKKIGQGAIVYYPTISKVNVELMKRVEGSESFPEDFQGSYTERLQSCSQQWGPYPQFYNNAFSIYRDVVRYRAFNTDELGYEEQNVRIRWSSLDNTYSDFDPLRVFLPLNYKDLDATFGRISSIHNVNGELISLQPRKFIRQFFNTRAQLQTSDNTVMIGTGAVMSHDGVDLSQTGCHHRWGAYKGRSKGGKDTLFFISSEHKSLVRWGYDGSKIITDEQPVRTLMAGLQHTKDKDEPYCSKSQGLRMAWNHVDREMLISGNCHRDWPLTWLDAVSYPAGLMITHGTNGIPAWPAFYKAKIDHASSPSTEPGTGSQWTDAWELIEPQNRETGWRDHFAFNEDLNEVMPRYDWHPQSYLRYADTILTPGASNPNLIYEHDRGIRLSYWGGAGAFNGVNTESYIEVVFNIWPQERKRFLALQVTSDLAPDRVLIWTRQHTTWLNADDFTLVQDKWQSTIYNDTTADGNREGRNENIHGEYMRCRIYFSPDNANVVRSILANVSTRNRITAR